jgi:hypothetical protein
LYRRVYFLARQWRELAGGKMRRAGVLGRLLLAVAIAGTLYCWSAAPAAAATTTTYTYDALGRLQSQTDSTVNGQAVTTYQYDTAGNRTTVSITAPPVVTKVAPANGPAAGGTSVIITGINLSSPSAVTFGGQPATNFTGNSSTQVTATAPPHGTGTVPVLVLTLYGGGSLANAYTYN